MAQDRPSGTSSSSTAAELKNADQLVAADQNSSVQQHFSSGDCSRNGCCCRCCRSCNSEGLGQQSSENVPQAIKDQATESSAKGRTGKWARCKEYLKEAFGILAPVVGIVLQCVIASGSCS